jgi:hypothetical protein
MPSKFPGTSAEVQNIVGKAVNRWRNDIKLQYQHSAGYAVTRRILTPSLQHLLTRCLGPW